MAPKWYDADGKAYVDYCMAYGAMLLGHANAEVIEAVKAQLSKGTLYGVPTELEVQFAESISKASPCMEMMRLVNTGTEATMHAIRAARGYTGQKENHQVRRLLPRFSTTTSWSKPVQEQQLLEPQTRLGIPEETTRNTIVLPYNDVEALETTFKNEGSDIAAVIVEPVMGNVGLILPKKDYLS